MLCRAGNRMAWFPCTGCNSLMLKRQFFTIVIAFNNALSVVTQISCTILRFVKRANDAAALCCFSRSFRPISQGYEGLHIIVRSAFPLPAAFVSHAYIIHCIFWRVLRWLQSLGPARLCMAACYCRANIPAQLQLFHSIVCAVNNSSSAALATRIINLTWCIRLPKGSS